MTKNVVDAVIEFSEKHAAIGLIPSRRQIEISGGYVNSWKTKEFCNYVRSMSKKTLLQRDHAGPGQGLFDDDGYESLKEDCRLFDVIHIDPWKKYKKYEDGLKATKEMIDFCNKVNPELKYEVGTEQSIRKFSHEDLESMLSYLDKNLGSVFEKIIFVVVQSGTSLSGNNQTGNYERKRLERMIQISRKFNIKTKEHNGDYISPDVIKEKMQLGLDAINIAPEFGLIETQTYLDCMDEESFDIFWNLCYASGRWKKWVDSEFDPFKQKIELVKICGHYVLSDPGFRPIAKKFEINDQIKKNLKNKLKTLEAS